EKRAAIPSSLFSQCFPSSHLAGRISAFRNATTTEGRPVEASLCSLTCRALLLFCPSCRPPGGRLLRRARGHLRRGRPRPRLRQNRFINTQPLLLLTSAAHSPFNSPGVAGIGALRP
uniref:Uncharacterized protein n=1 Tax=Triticum urartu TaxID=4572 RepID=A0A8R7P8C5_TRIUA